MCVCVCVYVRARALLCWCLWSSENNVYVCVCMCVCVCVCMGTFPHARELDDLCPEDEDSVDSGTDHHWHVVIVVAVSHF